MALSVFGVFDNWGKARDAVHRLHDAAFLGDAVNVIAKDHSRAEELGGGDAGHAKDGAFMGAGMGLVFGGTAGWALGLSALVIPGAGAILAAGPILGALLGASAGTAAGGLVGSMVGAGIPDYDAAQYERALEHGDIVIAVDASGRRGEAEQILRETGAVRVDRHDRTEAQAAAEQEARAEGLTPTNPLATSHAGIAHQGSADHTHTGLGDTTRMGSPGRTLTEDTETPRRHGDTDEDIEEPSAYTPLHTRDRF